MIGMQRDELEEQAIRALYALDGHNRKSGDFGVIDFDLLQERHLEQTPPFVSLEAALSTFDTLFDRVDGATDPLVAKKIESVRTVSLSPVGNRRIFHRSSDARWVSRRGPSTKNV